MSRSMPAAGPEPLPVALLLPGQGAQHPGMATGLYGHDEAFTGAADEVFAALGADGGRVRDDWLGDRPRVPVDHVTRSQILLFTIDYALGRTVESWGVRPAGLLGHSVGEMAGAVLAGVFAVADAARLMWDRVTRLAEGPAGGMVAVAAAPDALAPYLRGGVVVGAHNAPRQTVLAGPEPQLGEVTSLLREQGMVCRTVPASTPFHSPVLAPLAARAEPAFATVRARPPALPLISGYTAAPLTADQAADPAWWSSHPAAPVRFWPALDHLLRGPGRQLVECGPGRGLTAIARRHPAVLAGRSRVLPLLPAGPADQAEARDCLAAARSVLDPAAA
ncbi:acyltransferase domain-containing protein [Streptomyces sp. ISL-98]|uniref:acyltransferase domain-containing protein n=1 Tax=Streptomyces sp. ISL-98 TaxID=2819192 RepID=UPI001BE816DB|nr:acyltransferase domain-containing protein [Streptomyces sp. ISL-98]MBT2511496.1 acyltransferase domain-containing protein [Streptomyces sp. ISL-98]